MHCSAPALPPQVYGLLQETWLGDDVPHRLAESGLTRGRPRLQLCALLFSACRAIYAFELLGGCCVGSLDAGCHSTLPIQCRLRSYKCGAVAAKAAPAFYLWHFHLHLM